MISTYINPNQIFILEQNEKCNIIIYIRSNNRGSILTVIFVIIVVWELDVVDIFKCIIQFSYYTYKLLESADRHDNQHMHQTRL